MKVTNYSSPGQMKITNDDQLSRAALIKPLLSLQPLLSAFPPLKIVSCAKVLLLQTT